VTAIFNVLPISTVLDRFSKKVSKKIGERDGIQGKTLALAAIFNSGRASNAAMGAIPLPRFLTIFWRVGLSPAIKERPEC
jgi:hypothetical protein